MKDIRSFVLPSNYIGLIPESEFTDSCYAWVFIQHPEGGAAIVVPRTDIVLNNHMNTILSPAPTLEEILEALKLYTKSKLSLIYQYGHWLAELNISTGRDTKTIKIANRLTPIEAAFELWLKVALR